MAIPATPPNPMDTPARVALIPQMSKITRATTRDRGQHMFVLGRHSVGEGCEVIVSMLSQCVRDGRHCNYFGLRLPVLPLSTPGFGLVPFARRFPGAFGNLFLKR